MVVTADLEAFNMKTRIISGVIIGAVIVAVVVLGSFFSITFSVATAILGAICVFEVFNSTGFVKSTPLLITGAVFALVSPFVHKYALDFDYSYCIYAFVAAVVIISLIDNKRIYPTTMSYAIALPIIITSCLRSIVLMTAESHTGIFHLALIICYTVFADIGAYFIGVYFGKRKMAPTISPKKTYEGLVGGMGASVIGVLAVCLLFKTVFAFPYIKVVLIVLTAPLFVILGVIGDLFASYIKRNAAIKDFGDTIPGHGGIMDRIDSMLIVAPIFYIFDKIFNVAGI